MSADILLDAIGMVDDDLLVYERDKTQYSFKRLVSAMGAAVLIILLLAGCAMVVSPEFRNAVFSVFQIHQVEKPPAVTPLESVPDEDPSAPTIREIGTAEFGGKVTAFYFEYNGFIQFFEGCVYTCDRDDDHSGAAFWEITPEEMRRADTQRANIMISFGGTDFYIVFDYALVRGNLHVVPWQENMDEDPYRYGWNIQPIGNRTDYLFVTLPNYEEDYIAYPFLLKLEDMTLEPMWQSMPLAQIAPRAWKITEDLRYGWIYTYDGEWFWDIEQGRAYRSQEFFGEKVSSFYFLDESTAICKRTLDKDRFDLICWDITYGNNFTVAENVTKYTAAASGEGYYACARYPANQGNYGFIRKEDGTTELVYLKTGETLVITDRDPVVMLRNESPRGENILLAQWEQSGSDRFETVSLLNVHSGVLTVVPREVSDGVLENFRGWIGENAVVFTANTDGGYYENGCYFYIYDFSPSE